MTNCTNNTNDSGKVIYKELSYKLVGLAYEVYNTLGEGLSEKVYQKAYSLLLDKEHIPYKKELYYKLKLRGDTIAERFFDFLIDGKVILEFKVSERAYFTAYRQLLEYLKITKYKLGLIIRFTKEGVKVKRIPNIY